MSTALEFSLTKSSQFSRNPHKLEFQVKANVFTQIMHQVCMSGPCVFVLLSNRQLLALIILLMWLFCGLFWCIIYKYVNIKVGESDNHKPRGNKYKIIFAVLAANQMKAFELVCVFVCMWSSELTRHQSMRGREREG